MTANNVSHLKEKEGEDPDRHCVFRDSSIYRSIFVYPSPGEPEWQGGDILTDYGKSRRELYPWQEIDKRTKTNGEYHYRIRDSRATQYTTELLVREIITNPQSCLRTLDPTQAKLFYVPYMPSLEWHNGTQYPKSFQTSPYGQAIMDAISGNFTLWERLFGWTSKYWKRRNGSDHILVMSEPCHGLWHPRHSPGNFVYINAQKQLSPPIIISKDISQTFVEMYPKCAATNIVMPHPNSDGRWFNSKTQTTARKIAEEAEMTDIMASPAALPAEKELASKKTTTAASNEQQQQQQDALPRVLTQFYKAGNHGTCYNLRKSLEQAYECSSSNQLLQSKKSKLPKGYSFPHAFRQSTFCPCPGGDAPSAKRMFDALFAGCIPVILSLDFVWPFTNEIPGSIELLNPTDFSIRLDSSNYILSEEKLQGSMVCNESHKNQTIQEFLEKIPTSEIQRLRKGVKHAAEIYAYYQWTDTLPDNPLQESILPSGGAAQALVSSLAERAEGKLWKHCQEELKTIDPSKDSVNRFKC